MITGWCTADSTAASANNGASFTSTLISVPSANGSHKTLPLQDQHYVPKIAGVGTKVSVIWGGLDGDDVASTFVRHSANSGSSFGEAVNLTRGQVPAGKALQFSLETLAARGGFVYCVFVTTASDVYLRRSLDYGENFLALQTLTAAGGTDYINGGWLPVIVTDPSDPTGATVHVLWNWPIYCFSRDGGATFTKPGVMTPIFSYGGATRPYMAIGPDGKVHLVVEAYYYSSSFGGGDWDIFYRGHAAAPAPSGSNNSLHLVTNAGEARYDNMQVPASSYLNFTTQMTGEVWVRPYPGGVTTGSTTEIKPIFHKLEDGYRAYSLQTFNRSGKRQAAAQIRTTNNEFWVNPASSTAGLVTDGQWTHLAFTYDAAGGDNNFKLYMNGQLIASTTATGTLSTGDGLFFAGKYGIWDVAELRLWNRVLTQSEIAANRLSTLQGNEPGLNPIIPLKIPRGTSRVTATMASLCTRSNTASGTGPMRL